MGLRLYLFSSFILFLRPLRGTVFFHLLRSRRPGLCVPVRFAEVRLMGVRIWRAAVFFFCFLPQSFFRLSVCLPDDVSHFCYKLSLDGFLSCLLSPSGIWPLHAALVGAKTAAHRVLAARGFRNLSTLPFTVAVVCCQVPAQEAVDGFAVAVQGLLFAVAL